MEADPEKLSPGRGPRPAELAWSWAALPQAGEPAAAVLPWTALFLCSCWCGSGRVVGTGRAVDSPGTRRARGLSERPAGTTEPGEVRFFWEQSSADL